MSQAVPLDAWLAGEGFTTPWARHQARAALEQAGLTRPGKTGIAPEKLPRARDVLRRYVLRTCGHADCEALGRERLDGRLLVAGEAAGCEICAGSNNRRAALTMAAACRKAGIARILVLGGTGVLHGELSQLLEGEPIELRLVDGAERTITKRDALSDLAWAQLMVVWASTPLPHKVSVSYTDERPPDLLMITVARRGIEALCNEITSAARGGRRR